MAQADETTWRTFFVFCAYRVVLATFVGIAFAFLNPFFNLGVQPPGAMLPTLITPSRTPARAEWPISVA